MCVDFICNCFWVISRRNRVTENFLNCRTVDPSPPAVSPIVRIPNTTSTFGQIRLCRKFPIGTVTRDRWIEKVWTRRPILIHRKISILTSLRMLSGLKRSLSFEDLLVILLSIDYTHWDSLRLNETQWDSLRLTETHWDSLRLILLSLH